MTQPLYIVLHQYKTAGKTLQRNLERNFRENLLIVNARTIGLDKNVGVCNQGWELGRVQEFVRQRANRQTRCMTGHFDYVGIHELLDFSVEPRYITFLRDPVERCLSLFSHMRGQGSHRWHAEIHDNNWSLEQWLEHSEMLQQHNGMVRMLLQGSSSQGCYEEVQTERELCHAHLEEAKRRLRQFWYVGLTETFDEDSRYLYGAWDFRRFHPFAVVNASRRDKNIAAETRQCIAQYNALDIELYEFAKELRQENVSRLGAQFQANQAKTDRRRLAYDLAVNMPARLLRVAPKVSRRLTDRLSAAQ